MIDPMIQNRDQYDILIVDDIPDSLELLGRILDEYGFRVRPAPNGRLALESVAARLPDLILLDVKMPKMDGYEVCRRLKSNSKSRNVPVIFISAYGETENKVKGFEVGGVDYIAKPFEREEILARIESQLRLHRLTEHLEQEVNRRTAELTLANQQLRQQIVERRRVEEELSWEVRVNLAAAELSLTLLSPVPIDNISHLILEHGKRLTGSVDGYVGYIDPKMGYLVCPTLTRDTWDTCRVADKEIVFKKFTGLWGWVLQNRKPLLTNAPADDPRFSGTPPGHAPIHRFLSAPALINGTLVGQISLANADQDYTNRKLEVIKRLANLYAIAIQRQRAEESLRQSEERYRTIFQNSPLGIFRSKVDGKLLEINNAFAKMFGYDSSDEALKEIKKKGEEKYFHTKERERIIAEQTASTDTMQHQIRLKKKDGKEFIADLYQRTIFDTQGQPLFFDGIIEDISERKKAEEALRRLNLDLDRRVLDRTAKLEATNKELEAFAYSVSHDLRAPLRHIDGFLELLEKKAGTALDEQGRHYMDTISNAAQKMDQLIDDLLSFSRTGRQAMSLQPVDLESLASDIIRELKPDTAGRIIHWHIGDLPAVEGDSSTMRMVLANLIENAVKFTRPREKARIEIGSLPGKNSEAVIFVRDNGVGFDMTYADKLFGVFQRLHRADEFEGTGIGLANVRRIIARHGGRTWAEGEPDHGTTFYFTLPRSIQGAKTCLHTKLKGSIPAKRS
jgi:PAS domain S-box-containing protein